ncbi:hypothetical protein EOL73_00170 [Candidatus Saccharibacteria bacterium]|nr:hypothetical protein [Candidatus Saccharibacteria bacterium]
MKYNIEDWERIIWREENGADKFIEEFLHDEDDADIILHSVSWTSCDMKVECGLIYRETKSYESVTSSFSIRLWEDYYNKNK